MMSLRKRIGMWLVLGIFLSLALLGSTREARAQAAYYSGAVSTVGSGFSYPVGVAVDAGGDLFVADANNNAVKEIVAVNGQVSSSSTVKTVASGFLLPYGVAVDGSGDVFVVDTGHNTVKEIVAVNGQVSSSSTVKTVASGFSQPIGAAVDAGGDVFVADTGHNAVKEIVAVNGQVSSSSTVNTVGSGFSHPVGVAVGAGGNVFVADSSNGAVKQIQLGAINFGSVNVASTSSTVLVPFTFTASGQPGGWSVLTQGATGKDFTEVSGSTTCSTTTTYSSGQTCSVAVQFSPLHPGLRMGAVQLLGSSGAVIATAPLKGIGVGPQVVFPSNSGSTILGSGFSYPGDVAMDAGGDVFVADARNNAVKEIVAVNGQVSSSSTVNTVGSGFRYPAGVAVDAGGDVFVADYGNHAVKEIVAGNGQVSSSSTVNTVGSGFSGPYGVAVDASGNVFVADNGNHAVNNAVKEIVAVNGQVSSSSTVETVGSGFLFPNGVAVDAGGDVFVADTGHDAVKEIVAVNGQVSSSSTVVTVGSGFFFPNGVAVDAGGDVFVADSANNAVKELPLATAPSHTFPTATAVGSTDAIDGPFSFTVANDGNATLTFPVPASGTNPSVSANFAWDAASTCPQSDPSTSPAVTLAPGASCTAVINFEPSAAGTITGSVVLTDDALNAASPNYAKQTVKLSGTAEAIALSPTTLPGATIGAAYNQTITASGGTSPYTLVFSGSLPNGITLDVSTGKLSGTPTEAGSFNFTIQVTDNLGAIFSQAYTLTINKAATTTTLSASSTSVNPNQSVTLTATVTDATPGSTGTPTGTVSFYDGSSLLGTGTLSSGAATLSTTALNAGATNVITAVYGGDTNFMGSNTSASTSIVVAPLDFSFTTVPSSPTPVAAGGTAAFQFTLNPTYGSYPAAVNFATANLPPGATATYSPATVAANGGKQTITLTVKTSAQSAIAQPASSIGRKLAPLSLAFLLLPFFGLGRTRRRLSRLLCVLLLVGGLAAAVSLTGCGGSSSHIGNYYPISVTATSGTTQHQAVALLVTK